MLASDELWQTCMSGLDRSLNHKNRGRDLPVLGFARGSCCVATHHTYVKILLLSPPETSDSEVSEPSQQFNVLGAKAVLPGGRAKGVLFLSLE